MNLHLPDGSDWLSSLLECPEVLEPDLGAVGNVPHRPRVDGQRLPFQLRVEKVQVLDPDVRVQTAVGGSSLKQGSQPVASQVGGVCEGMKQNNWVYSK